MPMLHCLLAYARASRRRLLRSAVAGAALSTVSLSAQAAPHGAKHLLISEVGFDTVTETNPSPSAEFVEIFNPTGAAIALNTGAAPGQATGKGSYFLADNKDYYKVVNGKVVLGASTDFVAQFPLNTAIESKQFIVICGDSDTFLKEMGFVDGNGVIDVASFKALPGSPQLFEYTQDGAADGVPDMVIQSTTNGAFNLTNSGEALSLFFWDGKSDLVQDVDTVAWGNTNEVLNKSGLAVDGPDADALPSTYANETVGQASTVPTTSNVKSLQRKSTVESEKDAPGGNGITGEEESGEDWRITGGAGTFEYLGFTPGLPPYRTGDKNVEGASFLAAAATSAVDGPTGNASPLDYGADGSLSQLHLGTLDLDPDTAGARKPDAVYFAVRGWFNSPNNASMVLIDVDPGKSTGVARLDGPGNQLSDVSTPLNTRITTARFGLSPELITAGVGFDAALAVDDDTATGSGFRLFGSGGLPGAAGAFFSPVATDASNALEYGAAPLLSYLPPEPGALLAAPQGFEGAIRIDTLGKAEYLFVVAVTTTDDGSASSPNTLPESKGDKLTDKPQIIDRGVCYEVKTGKSVVYYADADGDGYGTTAVIYCGPPKPGLAQLGGDCDDNNKNISPGAVEACDGLDNNCNGQKDEGVTSTLYPDKDGDTFGTETGAITGCIGTAGYVTVKGDCDDNNKNISPGAVEACDGLDNNCDGQKDEGLTQILFKDADGDTFGDKATATSLCPGTAGYVSNPDDCNDNNKSINPAAKESCDGFDNDCDGQIDEGVTTTFYTDKDNDGFGSTPVQACSQPPGAVAAQGDCDDANKLIFPGAKEICGDNIDQDCSGKDQACSDVDADNDGFSPNQGDCDDKNKAIFPGAKEVCDGLDNDCDGQKDEGVTSTYYADKDNDGFGDGTSPLQACSAPNGYVTSKTDCNDGNKNVNPAAKESCDGLDNDCDGQTDEGLTIDLFPDGDGDGFGRTADAVKACPGSPGLVAEGGDCDDKNKGINPAAAEVCDGVDQDCDGQADDGVTTAYYTDADGDGFGDPSKVVQACSQPAGTSTSNSDCNDKDKSAFPFAPETCGDGVDQDCNGTDLSCDTSDQDGDGFSPNQGDCDDKNKDIFPGAAEICDGLDDNCNGQIDEGLTKTYFTDADGDSFGDPMSSIQSCEVNPPGLVDDSSDCDDKNKDVNPVIDEICGDGIDQNCDGKDLSCDSLDLDGDGFSPAQGDCDDKNKDINPDATEVCGDSVDNDCKGGDDTCGAGGAGGAGGESGAAGAGGDAGAGGEGGSGEAGAAGEAGAGGDAGQAGSGGSGQSGEAGAGGEAGSGQTAGSGGAAAGKGGASGSSGQAGSGGAAAGKGGASGQGAGGASGASAGSGGAGKGGAAGSAGKGGSAGAPVAPATPTTTAEDDGGCGCAVPGKEAPTPAPAGLLASLLLGLGALVRRRRLARFGRLSARVLVSGVCR